MHGGNRRARVDTIVIGGGDRVEASRQIGIGIALAGLFVAAAILVWLVRAYDVDWQTAAMMVFFGFVVIGLTFGILEPDGD